MKKFFEVLMLGVFVLSVSAMAQASFENDVFDFKQGAFTFKTDYVLSKFNLDVSEGSLLKLNDIKEFGFYKIASIQGKTTTLDGEPVWMNKTDDKGKEITNAPVTFHKGDKIGIYLKTDAYVEKEHGKYVLVEQPKTYTTTDGAIDGAQALKNNESPEDDGESVYFSLFLYDHDKKQSVYQYAFDGEPSNGEGGGSNLGGQPLPGLLLTLGLGGAAVAGISRKRRNRKA